MIDSDLFARANGNSKGFYTKHRDFPLKGIVFSSETGRMLTASLVKGKHIYYHTHGDHGEKITISQNEIIEKFDSVVKTYVIPKELEAEVLAAFKRLNKEKFGDQSQKLKRCDAELISIAKKIANLDDMRIDGEIDSEAYKLKRGKFLTEKERLLKMQKEDLAMEHMDTLTIDETVKLLINLYSTWNTWDIERKVSFIKMAAVKLEVNKEKCLQIQQKEVFEHLFWL